MKHGYARTIPADIRYGNCHSTKTSSGWVWSKLGKDSHLRNRYYKYEKRDQGPRPLTLASPIDGCTCSNCGANNTNGNVSTVAALGCACVVGTRQHTTPYQITSTPRKASGDLMIHLIQVRATNATSFQRPTYHHRYTSGLPGHLHLSRL